MKIEAQWKNTILDMYEKQKLINFVSFRFVFLVFVLYFSWNWFGLAERFVLLCFDLLAIKLYIQTERNMETDSVVHIYIYSNNARQIKSAATTTTAIAIAKSNHFHCQAQ